MTPDEKIRHFQDLVLIMVKKYDLVQSEQIDLVLERKMKVIDHKVAAVGEMVRANDSCSAERSLDRAVEAAMRLNIKLDALMSHAK